MMPRSAGLFAALLLLTIEPAGAPAADSLLQVTLDGRPVTDSTTDTGGIAHGRIPFVDLVKMIKSIDGLVVFGTSNGHETAHVTLLKGTADFTVGQASYMLANGPTVKMVAAPFMLNGNFYVPAAAFANLDGLTLARRGNVLALTSPPAPTPAPAASAPAAASEDEPSPAQALTVKPSAAADASGLHLRVSITNTTTQPYVLQFPTGGQVAFVVDRNGSDVFDSLAGKAVVQSMTTLTFAPNETKTFTDLWPGYAAAGAGRYTLRVRLMTAQPIDFPPVSLGVASPAPAS